MSWYRKLYTQMIIRVPGIHTRYIHFREKERNGVWHSHWFYLLWLNFRYYVLRDKSLAAPRLPSQGRRIQIPENGESTVSLLATPDEWIINFESADCISFDVFDTLILRPVRIPSDVFFYVGNQLNYPGFKALRIRAEETARIQNNGKEVTLSEIWSLLSRWTGIDPERGMEAEFQSEMQFCQPNPYFKELIPHLKQKGYSLIVCSDMYLSSNQIRRLLDKCGYPAFDRYYVSSDYRCSKADGRLFDCIREDLGQELHYVHIGDNRTADYEQASKHGFSAFLYHNVHAQGRPYRPVDFSPVIGSVYTGIVDSTLHNGLRQYDPAYELGFVYGGLFVTGFCQFIHEYVHAHGIERILFLARDGDVLQKAYNQLYREDSELCRYVLWSRLAATKLCASHYKDAFMNGMVMYKKDLGYTVYDIFHTMQLDDMMDGFCREHLCTPDADFRSALADEVQDYLESNWLQVTAHYRYENISAESYFREMIGDVRSAVAVDVGWVGSGPLMLRSLVEEEWKMDCRITGILAGTCGENSPDRERSEMELSSGILESYLFSSHHNRDIYEMHDAALGHNMLVELLLASDKHSFVGFSTAPGESYQFREKREKVDSSAIQKGILDFAAAYSATPFGDLKISAQDAFVPLRVLYDNPEWVQQLIRDSEINCCIES